MHGYSTGSGRKSGYPTHPGKRSQAASPEVMSSAVGVATGSVGAQAVDSIPAAFAWLDVDTGDWVSGVIEDSVPATVAWKLACLDAEAD